MDSALLTVSPQKAKTLEATYRVIRRSVDARQKDVKVNLTILCDDEGKYVPCTAPIPLYAPPVYKQVNSSSPVVHIIGAGPSGLFAALTFLEHGVKPVIWERGKDVSQRKIDIANLNRNLGLNAESNYCFGEGGAGTFSDGKLFSRSKKRGNMQRVMEIFHHFGAPDTILYEAHAHIGSDKLPTIIRSIRQCILDHGGEIHFESCIEHLHTLGKTTPILLAIGHSAHDTYRMLADEGVLLQTKGFAMGVRVEHPQSLVNDILYHHPSEEMLSCLGNASYSMVTQVNGRGVYSFCMCPGGHIVPAGTQPNGCVVNGMSASHRNSPYANSGMVVEIRSEDVEDGLAFQEELEYLAWQHGAPMSMAPAQRLVDFVQGCDSVSIPACSYLPGVVSSRLDEWLPKMIGDRLRRGFIDFDKKYHGFLTNDAVVLGVESRSSSAVRVVRDVTTMQSVSYPHLYPAGEGAGYAGGITSSALDGINAAISICTVERLLS